MTRRARIAAAVGFSVAWLDVACSQAPCPAKTLANIEARYTLAALAACKGFKSLAECPDAPALKARRQAEEEAASCR